MDPETFKQVILFAIALQSCFYFGSRWAYAKAVKEKYIIFGNKKYFITHYKELDND